MMSEAIRAVCPLVVVYWRERRDATYQEIEKVFRNVERTYPGRDIKESEITQAMINRAREYPISEMIDFNRAGFSKCLWHEERTASMHLKNNRVHCFGCGKNGDAIEVAMKLQGVTFVEAVRRLQ
jgi:DNA primase